MTEYSSLPHSPPGVQGEIQFCVLDEADLMLQMGFQEDVESIFRTMPDNKQTTLWSATMPRESDSAAQCRIPLHFFIRFLHTGIAITP